MTPRPPLRPQTQSRRETRGSTRPDSSPTLAKVTCPTLVVCGREDTLTPLAESEKTAAAVKGATLAVIPNAGHLPAIENGEAFTKALADFFGSLPQ